jgi:hypothetical protein
MPQVEITLRVEIAEGTKSLADIEEQVAAQLRDAGRELVARAIQAIEPGVLRESGGARQRRSSRYVLTRFGEVRYERWKIKAGERYVHPLDKALGLAAHQTVSPWLLGELAYLAQGLPYRQCAELSSRLLGVGVDHHRVWRTAQVAGAKARAGFADGSSGPPRDLPQGCFEHPMVVMELDGTGLKFHHGQGEAKLAIWYAGKDVIHSGRRGKRRRAHLRYKGVYASVAPAKPFAQTAARLCERHVRYRRAPFSLVISDGAPWIRDVVRMWIGMKTHQLDHFHGRRTVAQAPGFTPREAGWLWEWALKGEMRKVIHELRWRVEGGVLERKDGQDLLAYLHRFGPNLNAAKELARRGAPAELCSRGSGAIEHNIEIVVNRRLKRRGMFWSKQGAENVLALRCAQINGTLKEVLAA